MPLRIAFRIEAFETLPSTQSELRARLERGEQVDGVVVRASRQTQGRGRRERVWLSPPGGSYQSLAVRDPRSPSLGRGGSAVAVAVGVAESFASHGLKPRIKWPNDLLYRGKKLGGILTEYLHGHLLVGVGLNVANALPAGATALRGWDLEAVHTAVLAGIQRGLDAWLDEPASLPARFASYDALTGWPVSIEGFGRLTTGTARGVDLDGCLRVETADGTVSVCSGTVLSFGVDADRDP